MKEYNKSNLQSRQGDSFPFLLLAAILLLVTLTYSNTIYSPPILDGPAAFINNPTVYIDNLSFDSLKQIYSGPFGRTRFIPMLSFAVDHLIGQGQIVQFHLTNILVHLLATIALFLLVRGIAKTAIGRAQLRLLGPTSFALSVAALWSLHPIQTNSVTYLVQRMTSFAALFYFASLAGYIWARTGQTRLIRKSGWLIFVLAMLCAFLSKENSATIPLAVLLLEKIFITPTLGNKVVSRFKWQHWLILSIILILILPFATTKLSHLVNGYALHGRHFTMLERLFTELRVVVFYLSLLALPLPSRMNLDHDFPISHSFLTPPGTLLSLLLLTFLIWTAIRLRRRHPFLSFGIFFFFLNLLIESSVIPLELVFEHRLYLPSLGFMIVIVVFLDRISRFVPASNKEELKKIFFLGIVIISCTLAIATSLRNHVWRDKITLYQDIVRKSPLKPRGYANLGMMQMMEGSRDESIATLYKAIKLGKGQSEEYITAANNIVTFFVIQKKYQKAVELAERLIGDRPGGNLNFDNFPLLLTNLGVVYWKLGRYSDSLDAFRIGIEMRHPIHNRILFAKMEEMLLDASNSVEGRSQLDLDEGMESVYGKMAAVLLTDKDYKNTRTYLFKALALAPADEKLLAIKKVLDDETSRNQQAQALISKTNKPAASTDLGFQAALFFTRFIEKRYTVLAPLVGPLLKKAVQLEPESLSAVVKLARWLLNNGKVPEALKLVEHHLIENPTSPTLLELAGQCYIILDEKDKAAILLNKLLEIYPGHPNWYKYTKFVNEYVPDAEISE